MDIRGFTIPIDSIYFIDFEATRILPSGPGTGVKIYDYEQKPAAAPHPPEGMGAVDPYAFDVFKVGCAFQWFLEVSKSVSGRKRDLFSPAALRRSKRFGDARAHPSLPHTLHEGSPTPGPCHTSVYLPSTQTVLCATDMDVVHIMDVQGLRREVRVRHSSAPG